MNNLEGAERNRLIGLLGFGMIGIGLLICFFLARELLNTYNDFGLNGFFVSLTEFLSEKTLFVIDKTHSISIGDGGASVIAMFFLFLLGWTAASIAYALIKSGAQLLSPAFRSDVEVIKARLNRVLLSINKKDS